MNKISVIIPTLNEVNTIASCITHVKKSQNFVEEVIVVDAKSSDKTRKIAEKLGVNVILSEEKNRAIQMNLGAKKAKGNILYFLHGDTQVPTKFDVLITDALNNGADAGCFRFTFDKKHPLLKINAFFTRFPFLFCRGGDQSLFVKKEVFNSLGGFPEDHIIMEEYPLIKQLCKKYNFKIIPKNVVVSARKYEKNNYFRVQYANFLVFNMYNLGYPQEKLKMKYSKLLN